MYSINDSLQLRLQFYYCVNNSKRKRVDILHMLSKHANYNLRQFKLCHFISSIIVFCFTEM